MVECAKTAVFFRAVLDQLKLFQFMPTPIYNDNKSALTLSTAYSGKHKNVRYILSKITYLMDLVKTKTIKTLYKNTNDLQPDMGTKALVGSHLKRKRSLNMGHSVDV
jgi:hypothetical protein